MDEYISREETAKAFCEKCRGYYDGHCIHRGECDVDVIQTAPAADVQPVKHGRWILSDDKCWLTCSFCGTDIDVSCGAPFFYVDNDEVSHINFCPNCGCKMGGDSK